MFVRSVAMMEAAAKVTQIRCRVWCWLAMNAVILMTRMVYRLTKYCPIDHRNIVEKTLIKGVKVSVEPD